MVLHNFSGLRCTTILFDQSYCLWIISTTKIQPVSSITLIRKPGSSNTHTTGTLLTEIIVDRAALCPTQLLVTSYSQVC
jgi:hypothetical protein